MDSLISELQRIVESKDKLLSKGHLKIAKYVVNNYHEAAYYKAAKLGECVGVSESSVVRFASALGYKGYPEFQKALADEISERVKRQVKLPIGNESLTDMILEGDISRIQKTYEEIDLDVLNQSIDFIQNAKKVYIVGLHESSAIATYLGYNLNYILPDVKVITGCEGNSLIEQIYKITSDDVLIGISFPNYSYNVLKCMEYANSRQARIVTITDNKNSPMVLYSYCNLYVETKMFSILQSMVATMSLANVMIAKLCEKDKQNVINNIRQVKEVCNDYQILGNDEINVFDETVLNEIEGLGTKD